MFQNLLWVYGMAWMSCEISRPEILSQSAPDKNECILNLYSEDSVYL